MSVQPIKAFRTSLRACWITTYNLDLGMYDSFLFPRLGDPPLNAVVLADGARLDHVLQSVPAEEQWRLQRANRRWLLRGVRTGGAFHPKTILLADQASARLLVGSGNLSLAGLDSGFETFTEFTSDDPPGAAAISGWIGWMRRIVEQQADDLLSTRFAHLVRELPDLDAAPAGMLHNLDMPLLDQFVAAAPDTVVDRLHLAAPFYDKNLAAVTALIDRLAPRSVTVHLTERTSVDGRQLRRLFQRQRLDVDLRRYVDDRGRPVPFVHAKLVGAAFDDGTALLLTGSPNLSRAALLSTVGADVYANVETAVLATMSAEALVERFINPPTLASEPLPSDAVDELEFRPEVEPSAVQVRLLRAVRDASGMVDVFADRDLQEQWLVTDGEQAGRPGRAPLDGRLVWLVDGAGGVVSNRVVVDEPQELARELEEQHSAESGRPRELPTSDLDHPLGAVLSYLHQTCIMDVAETRAVELASRTTDTEADGSTGLWERLAAEELRRDPRISTYDRLRGRTHGLGHPLADLLAAMLARTPTEARPALTNVIPFPPTAGTTSADASDEAAPSRTWSTTARIRVRARNVLRRWADAIGDERLQWIDPLAPLVNFRVMVDALAWLYAVHYTTDDGAVLTEDDLDEIFRRLIDAALSSLSKITDARDHLPDHTVPLISALLYITTQSGGNYRTRVLDWQSRLQGLVDLDLIDPTAATATYVGEVLWLEITAEDVLGELLYAIDYIDDEEWCRRTADALQLASVSLEVPSQGQDLDVRLRVGGIADPLRDPVMLRLLAELRQYRAATSVAVFDKDGRWRLAIKPGESVALKANWLDEGFAESRDAVSDGQLRRLLSTGGSLADLFSPEHRAAS